MNRIKVAALGRLLETEDHKNVLVFARTRVGAAELAETLANQGFPAIAIHGDLMQNERERILGRFRKGQLQVLVATDVVGRGVDIEDVSHVINYDIPQLGIEYVHRIGRTARAGRSGEAITFVTSRQRRTLQQIEQYIGQRIERAKLPSREDVLQIREEQFKAKLAGHISDEITEADYRLIDDMLDAEFTPEQIVYGLLKMARAGESLPELDDIRAVSDKPAKGDRRRGEGKSRRGNRRHRQTHEEGMVRLCMNVGRSSGVHPGDVVHTIASTADIPGHVIGAIRIQHDKTYVDVPEAHVDAVLSRAKRGKIRGQNMKLARA